MKLLELWNKYQNSGINGNPVITDRELKELREKLLEVYEYLKQVNPASHGVILDSMSVQNTIFNREFK